MCQCTPTALLIPGSFRQFETLKRLTFTNVDQHAVAVLAMPIERFPFHFHHSTHKFNFDHKSLNFSYKPTKRNLKFHPETHIKALSLPVADWTG